MGALQTGECCKAEGKTEGPRALQVDSGEQRPQVLGLLDAMTWPRSKDPGDPNPTHGLQGLPLQDHWPHCPAREFPLGQAPALPRLRH